MEGEGHREKPGWDEQRQRDQARRQIHLQDNVASYAASLVQRMGDPGSHSHKTAQQLTKHISHEIESNICSICLELMIPPLRSPILLFPCGHNTCKDCLFERPPQGHLKKNLKLKLEKCALCRQKIESYALNQSLMTLICTYTNNKHLIQLEQQPTEPEHQRTQAEQQHHNSQQLALRCNILEDELAGLAAEGEQFSRNRAVLGEVIETLKREKRKVERQTEKAEEEGSLIAKCLAQKVEQLQFLEKQLREAQDRSKVINKALLPLLQEKERQELLLMQRLLKK